MTLDTLRISNERRQIKLMLKYQENTRELTDFHFSKLALLYTVSCFLTSEKTVLMYMIIITLEFIDNRGTKFLTCLNVIRCLRKTAMYIFMRIKYNINYD